MCVTDLLFQRGNLFIERPASGGEERVFARKIPGRLRQANKIGRTLEARLQRSFRFGAAYPNTCGTKLILQQLQLGIAAHIANDYERLTGAHPLPIAHEDLANDSTFLMLYGLAVQLYFELSAGDHGA